MKGLVILGVCAMNMFGIGTSTAQQQVGGAGEHVSSEIAETDCLTQVNNDRSKDTGSSEGNDDTNSTKVSVENKKS